MNPLNLRPLPAPRSEDESLTRLMEREGFVDEAVVTAMLASPYVKRSIANPEDLALAADDQDFAGWSLAPTSPLRVTGLPAAPSAPEEVVPALKLSRAPAADTPEQDQQARGGKLWWMAGIACALSTVFFAAVMFTNFQATEAPVFKKGTPPTPAVQAEKTSAPDGVGNDQP